VIRLHQFYRGAGSPFSGKRNRQEHQMPGNRSEGDGMVS